MKRSLRDFNNCGFSPDLIKVGDPVDAGTMKAITGVGADEAECKYIIQGERSDDILGNMLLFETVTKMDGGPYVYKGLCERGKCINRHPDSATPVFICSPYHETENLTKEFNTQLAIAAARYVFLTGDIPVVPHIYFPQFMSDTGYEREYGIAAGHLAMRSCGKIKVFVIDGYISSGMASDIEYATSQLALDPIYIRLTYSTAAEIIKSAMKTLKEG